MIDSVIKKGAYHKVMPQDYAISEVINGIPFIAIADGCSAGEHSEIGAMLQCKAAQAIIGSDLPNDIKKSPEVVFKLILDKLDQTINILGLAFDEMIATLRVAYILDDTLYTIETGDGYTLDITGPEHFTAVEYEYAINAPYYPAYDLFHMENEYVELASKGFGLQVLLCTEKGYSPIHHESVTFRKFQTIPLKDIPDTKFFGFATDGLSSYTNAVGAGMPIISMLKSLASIKQLGGMFLGRRFQKLDKELISQGYENKDDVGIALISLDQYRKAQYENSSM